MEIVGYTLAVEVILYAQMTIIEYCGQNPATLWEQKVVAIELYIARAFKAVVKEFACILSYFKHN